MKTINGYEIPENKRELIDSLVLQKVTVIYEYDPKEPEGISYYMTGILDKVENEYEIDDISKNISFSLSNIKLVTIKFVQNKFNIKIYLYQEK